MKLGRPHREDTVASLLLGKIAGELAIVIINFEWADYQRDERHERFLPQRLPHTVVRDQQLEDGRSPQIPESFVP